MFGLVARRLSVLVLLVIAGGAWIAVRVHLAAQEPSLAPPVLLTPGETIPPSAIKKVLQTPPPTFIAPGANAPGITPPAPVTVEQAGQALPFEQAPGILIVPISQRKWAGYSAETGGWKGYESPERMLVSPVPAEKIVAFTSIAEEVHELVCFSGPRGDFHRHGIPRSPGPVEPSLTSCLAWFQIPRGIIAYSALTNSWGDLEIRSLPTCEVHHTDTLLTVFADGRLHAFSAKTGRWDSVDLPRP